MDKASDYESGDSKSESWQGRIFFGLLVLLFLFDLIAFFKVQTVISFPEVIIRSKKNKEKEGKGQVAFLAVFFLYLGQQNTTNINLQNYKYSEIKRADNLKTTVKSVIFNWVNEVYVIVDFLPILKKLLTSPNSSKNFSLSVSNSSGLWIYLFYRFGFWILR